MLKSKLELGLILKTLTPYVTAIVDLALTMIARIDMHTVRDPHLTTAIQYASTIKGQQERLISFIFTTTCSDQDYGSVM